MKTPPITTKYTVKKYKETRFWAVFKHGALLCVTVYKKGALSLINELEGIKTDDGEHRENECEEYSLYTSIGEDAIRSAA